MPDNPVLTGIPQSVIDAIKATQNAPSPPADTFQANAGVLDDITKQAEDALKSWWTSKGIMGPAVALIATVVGWLGYSLTADDQATIITLIPTVVTVVASIVGIIGRVTASKKIG